MLDRDKQVIVAQQKSVIDLDKLVEDNDNKRGVIKSIRKNIKIERGVPTDVGPDDEQSFDEKPSKKFVGM